MILPQLFGRKKINFAYLKRIDFAVPANLVVGPVAGVANPEPAGFSQHAGNKGPDLNAYRVIDVRMPNGCHGPTGQVDRAARIPVGSIQETAQGLDYSASLAMICQSGGRSTVACQTLKVMGFADVTNLNGGRSAWPAAT